MGTSDGADAEAGMLPWQQPHQDHPGTTSSRMNHEVRPVSPLSALVATHPGFSGTRWRSSHTHSCPWWPLMLLSFGSVCSVTAALSFLGPPLARAQVRNGQTYRRLSGFRPTSTLPFFKPLKWIFSSSCEVAACSIIYIFLFIYFYIYMGLGELVCSETNWEKGCSLVVRLQ